jgi:hypothetical protein
LSPTKSADIQPERSIRTAATRAEENTTIIAAEEKDFDIRSYSFDSKYWLRYLMRPVARPRAAIPARSACRLMNCPSRPMPSVPWSVAMTLFLTSVIALAINAAEPVMREARAIMLMLESFGNSETFRSRDFGPSHREAFAVRL